MKCPNRCPSRARHSCPLPTTLTAFLLLDPVLEITTWAGRQKKVACRKESESRCALLSKGAPWASPHSSPSLSRGHAGLLLLQSQHTLKSFSFHSSWLQPSFYSNRTMLFRWYSPKVRKSYSSRVNAAFIYGTKSISHTVFASFFNLAK